MFVQGAAVLAVVLLFSVISSKPIASLFASSCFLASSLGVLALEFTRYKRQKSFMVVFSTAAFLVLFILPIIGLRIFHWGDEFAEITLGPITAKGLHQYSNYAFLLMLVGYFVESFRAQKKGS